MGTGKRGLRKINRTNIIAHERSSSVQVRATQDKPPDRRRQPDKTGQHRQADQTERGQNRITQAGRLELDRTGKNETTRDRQPDN